MLIQSSWKWHFDLLFSCVCVLLSTALRQNLHNPRFSTTACLEEEKKTNHARFCHTTRWVIQKVQRISSIFALLLSDRIMIRPNTVNSVLRIRDQFCTQLYIKQHRNIQPTPWVFLSIKIIINFIHNILMRWSWKKNVIDEWRHNTMK